MRKKNLLMSMLAMASMLFVTSCSQDEMYNEPATGEVVTAKFALSTPGEMGTRAAANIGEGTTVNYVACAVYDANGAEIADLRQYVSIADKKAEFSTRLVAGQAYRVVFFAYYGDATGASDYYDLTDLKNIQIKNASSNLEARDAFANYVDVSVEESMSEIEKDIVLKRPFAQLNLGSNAEDIAAASQAGIVVTKSKIIVSNVYAAFDAYNNDIPAGAQAGEMTFDMNELPDENLNVDMNSQTRAAASFEYLALNYLLVGGDDAKALTDVTFVWETADGKTNSVATEFKNVPVQTNYRTNIVGYLLTNPAKFNITIDDSYDKTTDADIWDGVTATLPTAGTDGVYHIASAAEFVGMMNDSFYSNCNKYKNVVLDCNIDFAGNEIKGFGDMGGFFSGEFDGQGHTVSNFKIDATGRAFYAGLFNQVSVLDKKNTIIKNLTVKNATVAGTEQVGAIVGGMNGDLNANAKVIVENCKVYNSNLNGKEQVASVVGFSNQGEILNCYAENCVVTYAGQWAGEIFGYKTSDSTESGNTFKDVKVEYVGN